MEELSEEKLNNEKGFSDNSKKPRDKSIKKNYIYNLLYQLFLIIVPLIVTPYISRVLTTEGVGQYSFSFSLITYFTLFGSLGFGYYAQREIARHQNDIVEQSKVFWEIVVCRIIPVSIALFINIIFCVNNLYGSYTRIMWVFNINIFAIIFDIAFYYQGKEEFGKLVLRNFIIKLLSIIAIFLFVKTKNDLLLYAFINSISIIISAFSMWLLLFKYLVRVKLSQLRPLCHLKGTILLFIPTIAISIYTILDKTLIGLLIKDTYIEIDSDGIEIVKKYSDLENGYYEQSEKIIKMVMTVITAIGTVMIPRNSKEFANGNLIKVRKNIEISSTIVLMIGIPLVLGIIVISDNFVPWFFGPGYDKCSILLKVLSPLIIIIGFSNVFGLQYLIPSGNDKKFTIALICGAIINICLNIVFIKFWWSLGAAIATIIAECAVTLIMGIMIRKEISFFKIFICGWKYYLSGSIMFIICYFIASNLASSVGNTLLIVAIGIVTYFLLLIILKEKNMLYLLHKIFKK